MLAFSFETYDFGTQIIFAENEQEAVHLADMEHGVEEVKRVPCFDKYSPGPIKDDEYLEEGWTIGCLHCEHRLSNYECDECETSVAIDEETGSTFCSEECLEDYKAERVRIKEKKQKATERLLKKVPFVTLGRAWIGGTGNCKNKCYDKDHENICIDLHFEGEKYNHSVYCDGCGKIWVAKGDKAAWDCISVQPSVIVNCTKN